MSKKRLQNGEKNYTANVMKNVFFFFFNVGVALQIQLLFTWPFKKALIMTQRS